MTYTVGGLSFPTKQDARVHASTVLNRAGLGEVLQGADERFARDLLSHHPDAQRKHGVGVDAIVVALIAEWNTRNFLVLRQDGSVDNPQNVSLALVELPQGQVGCVAGVDSPAEEHAAGVVV